LARGITGGEGRSTVTLAHQVSLLVGDTIDGK